MIDQPPIAVHAAAAREMTDDTTWTAPAERFVRALAAGRASDAAALVAPGKPAETMTAERLTQIWTQLTAQLGELAALTGRDVQVQAPFHSVNLAARFARSEMTLRVVLDAERRVSGFWVSEPRPPAYEPPPYAVPSRYTEHAISLGEAPFALGATYTAPAGIGPHPVVVLVHGSGPNDRDETIGANRPFRDLAWGLASRGIGVLRYDKRTYAHPRQYAVADITAEREVIDDALLAVAAARAQPGVDPHRVFVLGHSLGAGFAPLIAARDARVRGVIMLAGAARPLTSVLAEQITYIDSLQGSPAAAVAQRDALLAQLKALEARTLAPDVDVIGAPARYWYDLADHDVLAGARALRRPALVLQGGRDYQVTERDLALWREAFAGNAHASFALYPDLNHLFMTGTGKATPAEYQTRTGHVAEQVIADVAKFVEGAR